MGDRNNRRRERFARLVRWRQANLTLHPTAPAVYCGVVLHGVSPMIWRLELRQRSSVFRRYAAAGRDGPPARGAAAKALFAATLAQLGGTLVAAEVMPDHVHLFATLPCTAGNPNTMHRSRAASSTRPSSASCGVATCGTRATGPARLAMSALLAWLDTVPSSGAGRRLPVPITCVARRGSTWWALPPGKTTPSAVPNRPAALSKPIP